MIFRSAIAALLFLIQAGPQTRPVTFQKNKDQAPADVRYLLHTSEYQLDFKPAEMVFHFKSQSVRIRYEGPVRNQTPQGYARLDGLIRYLDTEDSDKKSDVPTFGSVRYESLYRGIDLVFYGRRSVLESNFVVAPYARPDQIRASIDGADRIEVNDSGELLIHVAGETIRFRPPSASQVVGAVKRSIDIHYQVSESNKVSLVVGDYDHTLRLLIG